jgi:two-component system, NarL family, response regulator
MSTIRVLLVEDDELFRLGLSTRLVREVDLEIAAEAIDGETAVEIVKTDLAIDIVILDLGLPGIDGLEACQQMRLARPELRILVLTSNYQPQSIEELITANVNGYCLKGMAADSIILAIRSIVAGASWWDHTASTEIFSAFRETDRQLLGSPPILAAIDDELITVLTKREQEILALVSMGKSNQEIATILFIAAGTVRVHVHAILSKLNVRDRTQAAILAIRNGLVDPQLLKRG